MNDQNFVAVKTICDRIIATIYRAEDSLYKSGKTPAPIKSVRMNPQTYAAFMACVGHQPATICGAPVVRTPDIDDAEYHIDR